MPRDETQDRCVYCKECRYFKDRSYYGDYVCLKTISVHKTFKEPIKTCIECSVKNENNDCLDFEKFSLFKWIKGIIND